MRRCPPSRDVTEIEDIQRLVGNEQLVAIKTRRRTLGRQDQGVDRAHATSSPSRLPAWAIVERLAKHATLPDAAKPMRSSTSDPTQRLAARSLRPRERHPQALAGLLRDAVQKGPVAQKPSSRQ